MYVVFMMTVMVKSVYCHRARLITTLEGYHCGNISIPVSDDEDNGTTIELLVIGLFNNEFSNNMYIYPRAELLLQRRFRLLDPSHLYLVPTETYHYHCVQCFFPQNCQTNNTCAVGTEGFTCEKCVSGYHRVGNSCAQCPTVPRTAIAFGVYILFLAATAFYSGFSGSVATKFKLLCHFLQLLVLSSHVKVTLSNTILQTINIISFVKFNTDVISLECLLFRWPAIEVQYLEWLVVLLIPLTTAIVGFLLDRSLRLVQSKDKEPTGMMRTSMRRLAIRRFVFMVLIVMYMPVTLTALTVYSCSGTIPVELVLDHTKDVYLLDNGRSCAEFIFQTLQFIAIIYLVGFSLLFPCLLVFFTLRQRKWNLLDTDRMKYGPVYDAYKNRYCFWEAIVLLRILISLFLTDTYPISPFVQACGQLTLTGFYLLLVIVFRPYRKTAWAFCNANNHVIFEVVSNLCLGFVQAVSLLILQKYWNIVEIIALVFICLVVLLWVVLMFGICIEIKEEQSDFRETTEEESMSGKQQGHKKNVRFLGWRRNKVGQDPGYIAELQERRGNVDF